MTEPNRTTPSPPYLVTLSPCHPLTLSPCHALIAVAIQVALLQCIHTVTAAAAEPHPRPNIVLVLADDHAFEAISAYGTYLSDFAKTPAIDRLAREGMRFDSFVCCNSICSPSRAAILTGQYSHRNGVRGLNGSINESSPHYPVELQNAGYQTWLVGKWHLRSRPKGYDKFMVVKGQGKYFNPTFNGTEGTWKRQGYSTHVYTDIAVQNHSPELFDRRADPHQLHNIAGNPENKTLIARLEEALQRQIQAVGISRAELPGVDSE